MWYEELKFIENPYKLVDPWKIPFTRIEWNRDDLPDKYKTQLKSFLERVVNQELVGMRIYGEYRSGKTWLLRYIEKQVLEKQEDIMVVKTKVPKLEANFATVYRIAISSVLEKKDDLFERISRKAGNGGARVDAWTSFFGDEDLATALFNIYQNRNTTISENWLLGEAPTASELGQAGLHSKLNKDYLRFEKLQTIIEKMGELYHTVLVFVDELENADPAFASKLSDSLRDLYASFYDRLAIVCSFTARRVEEWADLGYKAALAGRLEYMMRIESLKRDYVAAFLRLHQKVYREEDIDDHLYPFTQESIEKLVQMMPPEILVPGYLLPNCGRIAEQAVKQKKLPITPDFVEQNKSLLILRAV
jgi:hypothetical protein